LAYQRKTRIATYTLPIRKINNSPILLPILIFKHHTVLSGRSNTARSVTIFGTLELFAKN
jgi:hypothetical protein